MWVKLGLSILLGCYSMALQACLCEQTSTKHCACVEPLSLTIPVHEVFPQEKTMKLKNNLNG